MTEWFFDFEKFFHSRENALCSVVILTLVIPHRSSILQITLRAFIPAVSAKFLERERRAINLCILTLQW